jgi:methanogenic corrinoid protein MtbC1
MAATGSALEALTGGGMNERSAYGGESATALAAQGPPDAMSVLLETLQAEIIPRMLVAHRAGAPDATAAAAAEPPDTWINGIDRLADLVFDQDPDAAGAYVRGQRERGRGTAALLLQLLAPTARRLGEQWTADERSFAEVTLALGRLQALLWDLSLSARDEDFADAGPARGRVLISAAPGEQHTFGASMVAEFFRWWGWDVVAGPFRTDRALVRAVSAETFSVVGLSLSADRGVDGLATQISRLRSDSGKDQPAIMVGGRVFTGRPELATEVGADASADTAAEATNVAANLVGERQHFSC